MSDIELLEAAVKHENGNAKAVAEKLGYHKATISQIRNGKYLGNTKAFFRELKEKYSFLQNATVKCPGLKGDIHLKVCSSYRQAIREGKTIRGAAFAIVKQVCPFCPINEVKNET